MTETAGFDALLADYSVDVQELARLARALVLEVIPDAIEQPDPAARLIGYGLDRTYKGLICGIALQKTYVNLMLARGVELADPDGLLTGTGKRARHVKLQRPDDVAAPALRLLLEAAAARAQESDR